MKTFKLYYLLLAATITTLALSLTACGTDDEDIEDITLNISSSNSSSDSEDTLIDSSDIVLGSAANLQMSDLYGIWVCKMSSVLNRYLIYKFCEDGRVYSASVWDYSESGGNWAGSIIRCPQATIEYRDTGYYIYAVLEGEGIETSLLNGVAVVKEGIGILWDEILSWNASAQTFWTSGYYYQRVADADAESEWEKWFYDYYFDE